MAAVLTGVFCWRKVQNNWALLTLTCSSCRFCLQLLLQPRSTGQSQGHVSEQAGAGPPVHMTIFEYEGIARALG